MIKHLIGKMFIYFGNYLLFCKSEMKITSNSLVIKIVHIMENEDDSDGWQPEMRQILRSHVANITKHGKYKQQRSRIFTQSTELKSKQAIPIVLNGDMEYTYITIQHNDYDFIIQSKINTSIIHLLTWFNNNILNKSYDVKNIRDKIYNGLPFTPDSNIYLFNAFITWQKIIKDIKTPESFFADGNNQPSYIGHQGLSANIDTYNPFMYYELNDIKNRPLNPQRDDAGNIIFYCKVSNSEGDQMIRIDRSVSDAADLSAIFPGVTGSPKPHIDSLSPN